jgi:hypothetical protein
MPQAPHLLDSAHAEFISGGVSISLAACRPGALPNMARGLGCRVSAGLDTLTVFLAATPGAALLDDVRRTGCIAVVFSQPSTHRTVQFKGADARIVPLEAGDGERASRYVEAFVAELSALGYPGEVIRTMLECEPDDVVALAFTISAAFSQTPGPKAGEPLAAVS